MPRSETSTLTEVVHQTDAAFDDLTEQGPSWFIVPASRSPVAPPPPPHPLPEMPAPVRPRNPRRVGALGLGLPERVVNHGDDCDCTGCNGVYGAESLKHYMANQYGLDGTTKLSAVQWEMELWFRRMEVFGTLSYQAALTERGKLALLLKRQPDKTLGSYIDENHEWFRIIGTIQYNSACATLGMNHPRLVKLSERSRSRTPRDTTTNLFRFMRNGGAAAPSTTSRKARRMAAMEHPLPMPTNPWVTPIQATDHECQTLGFTAISPSRRPIQTPTRLHVYVPNTGCWDSYRRPGPSSEAALEHLPERNEPLEDAILRHHRRLQLQATF